MNFNLTPLQWLGIVMIVNGALIGATTNLTDLFGSGAAHIIVSIASLGNSIVGGIITMLTGQSSLVKNVASMSGVERISVNTDANSTLAAVATDKDQPKVGPANPNIRNALENIAKS